MNDFTKEELDQLLSWADIYTEFGTSWVTENQIPLINKIQSMIDNYCKHEWRSSAIDAIYCPHCQKHVECKL